jgi:hypothetical protein
MSRFFLALQALPFLIVIASDIYVIIKFGL